MGGEEGVDEKEADLTMKDISMKLLNPILCSAICLAGLAGCAGENQSNSPRSICRSVPDSIPSSSSVEGTWYCTHPNWKDIVTFRPDGTYSRETGSTGHWITARLQGKLILIMAWDRETTEVVTMMGLNTFEGKVSQHGKLIMRRCNLTSGPPPT